MCQSLGGEGTGREGLLVAAGLEASSQNSPVMFSLGPLSLHVPGKQLPLRTSFLIPLQLLPSPQDHTQEAAVETP